VIHPCRSTTSPYRKKHDAALAIILTATLSPVEYEGNRDLFVTTSAFHCIRRHALNLGEIPMSLNRRELLQQGAALTVAGIVASVPTHAAEPPMAAPGVKPGPGTSKPGIFYPFALPPLPVEVNALEPHIDAKTMEIHHDKHHQAYITNLNNALKEYPDLQKLSLHELLRAGDQIPDSIRTTVRNNGGGHANHTMFWSIMRPAGVHGAGGQPTGALAKAINDEWGDLEKFKTAFNEAGTKLFGSGWVVLASDKSGKLKLLSQPNQDSVVAAGFAPIFGNDVWEHAYYLNYQNRRADYLKAWWNVLAWDIAGTRYESAKAGKDI
jgi:Fe-Mn family superoxide dismutase